MKTKNLKILFLHICFLISVCSIEVEAQSEISDQTSVIIKLNETLKPTSGFDYNVFVLMKPTIRNWKFYAGKAEIEGQQFKIGIYDKNENGSLDDLARDILFVTSYFSEYTHYTSAISANVCVLQETNTISVNGQYYRVSKIVGKKKLKIERITTDKLEADIKFVSKLPDVILPDLSGLDVNIRDLGKGKKVRLEFWATWCESCISRMHELKLMEDLDEYRTILLLCESDLKEAQKILKSRDFNWICLQSKPEINRMFNQNGYPFVVYIDENGNIEQNKKMKY